MEKKMDFDLIETGNKDLDAQHERIIEYMKDFSNASKSETDKKNMTEIMKKISFYAISHLEYEESGMLFFNYPDRLSHVNEHDFFRYKIKKLEEKLTNNSEFIATETMAFLLQWFINHINKVDFAYAKFLSEVNDKK